MTKGFKRSRLWAQKLDLQRILLSSLASVGIRRTDGYQEGTGVVNLSNGRPRGNVDLRSRESRAIRQDTTNYRHPTLYPGQMRLYRYRSPASQ